MYRQNTADPPAITPDLERMRRIGEYTAYLTCLKIVAEGLPPATTRPCEYDEGQRMAKGIYKEILAKLKSIAPGVVE